MQYGERDARVPLPQGLEFYRAMKELGVPCQLVIYPGQGHGITEPRYQKDLMQRNLDWFERWIR
jgi:dipeptidyl aminopeptidase/acylaminoacyl peptidase